VRTAQCPLANSSTRNAGIEGSHSRTVRPATQSVMANRRHLLWGGSAAANGRHIPSTDGTVHGDRSGLRIH
jgi:hypothetical protein